MKIEISRRKRFVSVILPWLVATAGLLVYLTTLNHWVSFASIDQVATITGLAEEPPVYSPAYFLATYPLHWLPAKLAPISLNIFSAACAALSLALLARSVALLPHDRTHDQRQREEGEFAMLSISGSWIPPVLAAVALGLQLTIWESATNGAKEMLDLLFFAYVIRCLLEYRIDERDSWLFRAAAVYGVGMTGNWVMIGLLPAFFFAMVWIRGVSFFNLRFLAILAACGLAGLLLYLVLPAIYVHAIHGQVTFWQVVKYGIKGQLDALYKTGHNLTKIMLLLLALTSLLPVLLIGIRWASHFGDPSPMGTALTSAVFHLTHAAFFGACLWAAFDPAFGLRVTGGLLVRMYLGPKYAEFVPNLVITLSYLSTIALGYFTGYFLLVVRPVRGYGRQTSGWKLFCFWTATGLVYGLVILIPAGLIFKNLERIHFTNGKALAHFAAQLAEKLPSNAVVLSDDFFRLNLSEMWSEQTGGPQDRIYLNTRALLALEFQRQNKPEEFNRQLRLHPDEWLTQAEFTNALSTAHDQNEAAMRLQNKLLEKFSEKRPLYYLHPSFGNFFEAFYPVPHGLVYELRPYATNSFSMPPPTGQEISENEAVWKVWRDNTYEISKLRDFMTEKPAGKHRTFREWFNSKLHIPFDPLQLSAMLTSDYSLALNYWGLRMQMAGKLAEAGTHFLQATNIYQGNIAAQRNYEFNQYLQSGLPPAIQYETNSDSVRSIAQSVRSDFGNDASRAQQEMLYLGPFDEPTHRLIQGNMFASASPALLRQSAQQFERIAELIPDNLPARMRLAESYVRFQPGKALDLINSIRQQAEATPDSGISRNEILSVESQALYAVGEAEKAEKLLSEAMEKNPKDVALLSFVFQFSSFVHSYTNALTAINHALELQPNDVNALVNKGFLAIQIGDFEQAIPPLTTAISLETNNNTAKFDRALAYLNTGKLEEARADYEDVAKAAPNFFPLYYGLGEIAWRKHDTNNAIRYYDLYIANAPANTEEAKTISERLQDLRNPGTPPAATAPPQTK